MTTIGFIGLGTMGFPMAANLVRADYDVVGYNRSPNRVQQLIGVGGRSAGNVAEAASDADVIISMLPDSSDVKAVALGESGILANARSGACYVDMSSIRPDVSVQLSDAGRRAGLDVLDAPVSGGEQGAKDGTLSIMVGGSADGFHRLAPIFAALGKTVVHVGDVGAGQIVKAANQLIVAGTIELVAEAIVFLEAHSVDTGSAIAVLSGGLAGNRILDQKAAAMVKREFQPGFRAELHRKDLAIVTSAAAQVQVALPLGSAVAQLMTALVARGGGRLDHSALLTVVEELSGRRNGMATN
jgi:2-hydroxy-3-oxopropionate reductase